MKEKAFSKLPTSQGEVGYFRLEALEEMGEISTLPLTIKVLLEAALRRMDGIAVTEAHIQRIAAWSPKAPPEEIPFLPARVLLQDFTGVPAVVDLAAMREAMARLGGDPARINPRLPSDLVIDHSVQVDAFGSLKAIRINTEREIERNLERYTFLRWGQGAFDNFHVVPPESGIVHQVNLEYLARGVMVKDGIAFPDSLVGTDSHTTMINGLGVLGWGVGGIEAEAVMLGQPLYITLPQVVGMKLTGELPEGATATDLVLALTERLRKHGVVGKFVEFFGEGVESLSLPDRATLANMAPEYGATTGFFPIDDETLRYLRATGRDAELVERYAKAQGLFRGETEPRFSEVLELDLSSIEPSLAGPRRPQDRVPLKEAKQSFFQALTGLYGKDVEPKEDENPDYARWLEEGGNFRSERHPHRHDLYRHLRVAVRLSPDEEVFLSHGSVAIAAITSCTNTSNPSVMLGAGILAKKAVERGLTAKPWVKTSLAPGSKVVTRYLERSGLLPFLEALRFHVVGYGCTTCIGNSGPLPSPMAEAVEKHDLVVCAVLSGNRNFEGRINPLVKANYLASPPLVVAYAIAGTMDIDMVREPLAHDPTGEPVYLKDLWPTPQEIQTMLSAVSPEMFKATYAQVFEGSAAWKRIPSPQGTRYAWDPASTYIQEPPFFKELTPEPSPPSSIRGARVLALLGDSVTTDHISPAGAIPLDSPAGQYLLSKGVKPQDFNSYGSRRGNHEVMMRGTFANIRLKNLLAPGTEGGYTVYLPTGEVTTIFEAAMRYQKEGTPLIVLAGKEYGTGSSRDWAAKGTKLLGVKAVIAESYERIHRANLVGMGVLPLQFLPGENWQTLGITGHEVFDIDIPDTLTPGQPIEVKADGKRFETLARIDSPVEVEYYRHGGILPKVLREMLPQSEK